MEGGGTSEGGAVGGAAASAPVTLPPFPVLSPSARPVRVAAAAAVRAVTAAVAAELELDEAAPPRPPSTRPPSAPLPTGDVRLGPARSGTPFEGGGEEDEEEGEEREGEGGWLGAMGTLASAAPDVSKRYHIPLEALSEHFGMNLVQAAQALGVCRTTLKRVCRSHGIRRWPKRSLAAAGARPPREAPPRTHSPGLELLHSVLLERGGDAPPAQAGAAAAVAAGAELAEAWPPPPPPPLPQPPQAPQLPPAARRPQAASAAPARHQRIGAAMTRAFSWLSQQPPATTPCRSELMACLASPLPLPLSSVSAAAAEASLYLTNLLQQLVQQAGMAPSAAAGAAAWDWAYEAATRALAADVRISPAARARLAAFMASARRTGIGLAVGLCNDPVSILYCASSCLDSAEDQVAFVHLLTVVNTWVMERPEAAAPPPS